MEQQTCLGISLTQNGITAALWRTGPAALELVECINLTCEQEEKTDTKTLIEKLAGILSEKAVTAAQTALAINCSLFTQHNLHSDFTDKRQIAQTIRYDLEEVLANDTSELAIAFKPVSRDDSGSDVTVFAAENRLLEECITSLKCYNMEPITIEPDVACLTRFMAKYVIWPENTNPIAAIFSHQWCYLMTYPSTPDNPLVRTFLTVPARDNTDLAFRQITLTKASLGKPVDLLVFFDAARLIDCRKLQEKLALPLQEINPAAAANIPPEILPQNIDLTSFAVASGAAIGLLVKTEHVDFRESFMPYEGKKLLLQKTLRFLGTALAVFLFITGLFLQMQLVKVNKYRSRLHSKLQKDYAAVMFGTKLPATESVSSRLGREITRVQEIKSGLLSAAGQESLTAKLTSILEAFNDAPADIDLQIDTITVTTKTVVISGDTNSRQNTLRLFDTIKNHPKLNIAQSTYEIKADRDKFRITIEPKLQSQVQK